VCIKLWLVGCLGESKLIKTKSNMTPPPLRHRLMGLHLLQVSFRIGGSDGGQLVGILQPKLLPQGTNRALICVYM
jgi:hypothetical protein